jgi:hypothetical protein
MENMTPEAARAKALTWFKDVVNSDAAKTRQFEAIWKQSDRSVLDRLTDTITLGDARVARVLSEARNPLAAAPTEVPAFFKDAKVPAFVRANAALAFAKALSNRRVHEQALQALQLFRPEQVAEPATYLFHRAVCEHALLEKTDAAKTIGRLLQDTLDSPERYKTVGMLILLDMQTWKEKDLAAVGRKMNVIKDRLDIARGGPQTRKLQKEVIDRLDELIKELENKQKQKQQQQGGS